MGNEPPSVAVPLYFEDMRPGACWQTAARTVTEADIVNFSGVSGDYNWMHIDEQAAAESSFGGRIAHGLLVLSMATGLRMQSGLFNGTVIAFLGIEEWRFAAPVHIGDTIHVSVEIESRRETSTAGRGIVRQRVAVINQRGETVQTGVFVTMIKRRSS